MSESAHRIMMNIFLLTPLREGRRHTPPDIDNNVSISTHAPAGGATSAAFKRRLNIRLFLLTPLREGRLQSSATACRGTIFLLTPLREGRPRRLFSSAKTSSISTHAPAGGATGRAMYGVIKSEFISTHAPAGGATLRWRCVCRPRSNFYSRPCGRGDGSYL